jgi:hypothetical protein
VDDAEEALIAVAEILECRLDYALKRLAQPVPAEVVLRLKMDEASSG